MANLDDLGFTSITDMSTDEALETLRQIRLSRRIPVKTTQPTKSKDAKASPKISEDQAAELLRLLTGDKQ